MSSAVDSERKDVFVEDLSRISETYPGLPEPLVERDFLIESILDELRHNDAIFLAWPEGYGKTTLLSQFVKKKGSRAINLFIESRWTYEPESVRRDLCNQMHWILNGEEIGREFMYNNGSESKFLVNRYFRKVNKKGRRGDSFYIVIDGLEDIPDKDKHARDEIINSLPFGAAGISFVFSGEPSLLPEDIRPKVRAESFSSVLFGKQDTEGYLGDLVSERQKILEIHNTCRSIPGRLASVRRILEKGVSAESILRRRIDEVEDLFDVEWEDVSDKDREVLALISFADFELSTEEIADVLGISKDEIESRMESLSFVNAGSGDGSVSFVSDAFRRYAKEKLSDLKTDTRDVVVDYLIENMESDRSIRHLPVLLGESGQHEKLIEVLSPDYFYRVLEQGQSLGFTNQVADLAFEAADKKDRFGAKARFSLHKSAVNELWGAHARRSEVRALMALEELDEAVALADTALSSVERLHLLAIIARMQKDQVGNVDEGLRDQIQRLSEDVNASDLQNRAEEIAVDLISVDPELALRLVERGTEAGTGEHSLDVAYLQLTMSEVMRSQKRAEPGVSHQDSLEDIHSKIQSPSAREVSSKLRLLVGDYSAEKVLEKAKSFEKTGDRLYFLRLWTQAHARSEEAGTVIEYALKQIIQNMDYAHDAGSLRELAEPLPHLDSNKEIERLVRIFDQQKQTSILVEELVRLEILLARAEANIDIERADDRLLDLYLNLEQVSDLATRTEGWARLISALPLKDNLSAIEEDILQSATKDLEQDTKMLLSKSAKQENATRHVIQALANNYPEKALRLADSLNTKPRRNKGALLFVDSILKSELREVDAGILFRVLDQISSDKTRTEAVSRIFDRLADERTDVETAAEYANRLFGKVGAMSDAEERCKTAIQGYELLVRATEKTQERESEFDHHPEEFLAVAEAAFEAQDNDSKKIATAFEIVSELAGTDRETAREFKDKAERLRGEIVLDSGRSRASYLASLDLVVRSFRGLLPRKADDPEDLQRIVSLIDKVRSVKDRVRHFSNLAFSCFRCGRDREGKEIVKDKVRTLLGQIPEEDKSSLHDAWAYAAPALYLAAKNLTLNDLERKLPLEERDRALSNIANGILNEVMPSEPVDFDTNRESKLEPEEIHDLVDLLGRIETDVRVYKILEGIVEVILEDKHQRTYDRTLRIDVEGKLREIAEDSFPNTEFIQHDGYLILAKADLILLKDTYKGVGTGEWLDLVDQARCIENEADRALVLSQLAEKCPSSGGSARKHRIRVLEEVEELVQEIPSAQDRVGRFGILARAAKEIDESLARNYFQKAFSLLYDERENMGASTLKSMRRRILSSAYRIDPEFASSLANLVDDDPAHQQELEQNIERLEKRSTITTSGEENREASHSSLPSVCWDSLAALNAGRLNPVRVDRAEDILEKARAFPLEGAYPIQSFTTEGLVRSYENTDEASKIIRPVFEAALQNTRFIERLAVRSSSKQDQVKAQASKNDHSSEKETFNIRAGERGRALNILREWVSDYVEDRLVICDQYFGPGQVEALNLIQSVVPDCVIEILSSEKHHLEEDAMNLKEAYVKAWREKYDQEIPSLRIVVAGKQDGSKRSPIHDRWWLSEQGGLRLGTSFNGLGQSQASELSLLEESERARKIEEVERYLVDRDRDYDGTRVSYQIAII